jgi:hypothetical protein
MDLVCLVADRSIEAAIEAVLRRHDALGIRPLEFETLVHPERDPGCFHEPAKLLGGCTDRARHALVVLDRAWAGAPATDAAELERLLEQELTRIGPAEWARAVVIEPELEAWVFSDSPHVATTLGWTHSADALRGALEAEGLWERGRAKPADPKRAMDWALRRARLPRSSSLFRTLGSRVSLRRCKDRSFLRLAELLRGWFGVNQAR